MKAIEDRTYWIQTMIRIADPLLNALAEEKLKVLMPVEGTSNDRKDYCHLEAFGRLASGMSSWIENGPRNGEEGVLREKYAVLTRRGIEVAIDLNSPDNMNFSHGKQPIVDAAFLAHAIVRAPTELYAKLPANVKQNLVKSLKATRTRKPYFSNWLLF